MKLSLTLRFALPFLRLFTATVFLVLGPPIVRGSRRVPGKGGVLVLANHIADIDPILVQLACRRTIHFMANSELFEIKLMGPLIRWFRAFPVKRGEPDRPALRHAIELLRLGEVVCVFPEGELSESGELQALLPGAALIVRQAGVPVICCGLQRTNRILPYGSLRPRISLCFTKAAWGKTKSFDEAAGSAEILAWAETELRNLTNQTEAI